MRRNLLFKYLRSTILYDVHYNVSHIFYLSFILTLLILHTFFFLSHREMSWLSWEQKFYYWYYLPRSVHIRYEYAYTWTIGFSNDQIEYTPMKKFINVFKHIVQFGSMKAVRMENLIGIELLNNFQIVIKKVGKSLWENDHIDEILKKVTRLERYDRNK